MAALPVRSAGFWWQEHSQSHREKGWCGTQLKEMGNTERGCKFAHHYTTVACLGQGIHVSVLATSTDKPVVKAGIPAQEFRGPRALTPCVPPGYWRG